MRARHVYGAHMAEKAEGKKDDDELIRSAFFGQEREVERFTEYAHNERVLAAQIPDEKNRAPRQSAVHANPPDALHSDVSKKANLFLRSTFDPSSRTNILHARAQVPTAGVQEARVGRP